MTAPFATESIPLHTVDGVIRIMGTRVTFDTVIGAFLDGATAEDIVEAYSTLTLADVYTVIGYYLRYHDHLDYYLQERQQVAALVRQQNEQRFPPMGIRARLLARQQHRT